MQRILLIAEQCASHFNDKVLNKVIIELLARQYEVVVLPGEDFASSQNDRIEIIDHADFRYFSSIRDEHRFTIGMEVAKNARIDHIHFMRLYEPQKLWLALEATASQNIPITAAEYGFPRYFRFPTYVHGVNQLLKRPEFRSFIIHSLAPAVMDQTLRPLISDFPEKIRVIHEMHWYQKQELYQIEKKEARKALSIPEHCYVILYFGAYFFSKGPDLLLEVAQKMADQKDCLFIFAGDPGNTSFVFRTPSEDLPHIRFDKDYISDEKTGLYFAACDLVTLPYRKTYEFNTSGVFLQACIAGRPLLVPHLTPFKDVVREYSLGETFTSENIQDLEKKLRYLIETKPQVPEDCFKRYLDHIESCKDLVNLIMEG